MINQVPKAHQMKLTTLLEDKKQRTPSRQFKSQIAMTLLSTTSSQEDQQTPKRRKVEAQAHPLRNKSRLTRRRKNLH
jgi:hypothetical protein